MVKETFEQQKTRNKEEEATRIELREKINAGQMQGELHNTAANHQRVFMGYDDAGNVKYEFVQVFE